MDSKTEQNRKGPAQSFFLGEDALQFFIFHKIKMKDKKWTEKKRKKQNTRYTTFPPIPIIKNILQYNFTHCQTGREITKPLVQTPHQKHPKHHTPRQS
jgi:hypothetical protein